MKKFKRLFCLLLVCCIMTSMVPICANAEESNEPVLIGFTVQNEEGETVSLLGNSNTVTLPVGSPYAFEVTFSRTDSVSKVYITSTVNHQTAFLEAKYDENTGTYKANGFFNGDSTYIPGNISVRYAKSCEDVKVSDSMDWSAFQSSLNNCPVTVVSSTSNAAEATIDISSLVDAEQDVLLNTSIDVFDATLDTDLEEWLGEYRDLEKISKNVIEGGKYLLYLDYSNPKTYAMIIKDVSGNKYTKLILDKLGNSSETLAGIADNLGTTSKVSSLLYNYLSIKESADELHNQISTISSLSDSERYQLNAQVDSYENNRQLFTLISTALPVVVGAVGATMSGPAILFSALLGVVTASADSFWDYRVGLINGGAATSMCVPPKEVVVNGLIFQSILSNNVYTYSVVGYTEDIPSIVNIPAFLGSCPVTHIANCFEGCEKIEVVNVPEGVRLITDCEFKDCPNLVSVHLPNSAKLGYSAIIYGQAIFKNCTSLIDVVLPNNITGIGQYYFEGCTSLKTLAIPDTVTRIRDEAFSGCTSLESIQLPPNLTTIESSVFKGCSSLESIDIPNSVTTIEYNAFEECTNLTRVTLPNALSKLSRGTFDHTNIDEIVIPESVTEIGSFCFNNCSNLHSVYFLGNAPSIEEHAFISTHNVTAYYYPTKNGWNSSVFQNYDGTIKWVPIGNPPDKKVITESMIPDISSRAYTGSPITPDVAVYDGDVLLKEGEEYILSYTNNTNAGTATATITGKGNYTGTVSKTFTIQPKDISGLTVTITGTPEVDQALLATVSGAETNGLTYAWTADGSAIAGQTKPYLILTSAYENKEIAATVTGSDNYTGTASAQAVTVGASTNESTSVAVPAKPEVSTNAGNKQISVSVSVAAEETDKPVCLYEIQLCDSTGTLIETYYSLTNSYTITGLTNRTAYQVKAIAYNVNGASAQSEAATATPKAPTPSGGSSGGSSTPEPEEPEITTNPDGSTTTTETAEDGTVTATTTWDDGKQAVAVKTPEGEKTISVTTANGEKVADVNIPAKPGAGKEFEDVKPGAWYESAVNAATGYKLFGGTSDAKFSPEESMTRGMLVTVLHNLSGNPQYGTGSSVFEDVKTGIWYENPVDWAYKAEIVGGTGNNSFSPDKSITREELVTMLYNYAGKIGASSKKRTQLTGFPDGGKVSGYAQSPMQWAVAEGFISGRAEGGKNYIAPQGTATRAEVAAVLTRFVEYLKK